MPLRSRTIPDYNKSRFRTTRSSDSIYTEISRLLTMLAIDISQYGHLSNGGEWYIAERGNEAILRFRLPFVDNTWIPIKMSCSALDSFRDNLARVLILLSNLVRQGSFMATMFNRPLADLELLSIFFFYVDRSVLNRQGLYQLQDRIFPELSAGEIGTVQAAGSENDSSKHGYSPSLILKERNRSCKGF